MFVRKIKYQTTYSKRRRNSTKATIWLKKKKEYMKNIQAKIKMHYWVIYNWLYEDLLYFHLQ